VAGAAIGFRKLFARWLSVGTIDREENNCAE